MTERAERAIASNTGLLLSALRPLGGAAPVDRATVAVGAVLLAATPDVEPPYVKVPVVTAEGAGVGLPVSPDGIPIGASEVRTDREIGAVVSSTTDGFRVGKPVLVSFHSPCLMYWGVYKKGSTQASQGSLMQTA